MQLHGGHLHPSPNPTQAILPSAPTQPVATARRHHDIPDDDPRNMNYPKSVEEAFDRVKAMMRWFAAGDIGSPVLLERMDRLHKDFPNLQQLLTKEQEEIDLRANSATRSRASWGPLAEPRAAAETARRPASSGWNTSTEQPKTGWGNAAAAKKKAEAGWTSGPAANGHTPRSTGTHHTTRQRQQQPSGSPWGSGNNHDNHMKWQRSEDDLPSRPPPSADFSQRGRSHDRSPTDRYVDSHDRANRSRSFSPSSQEDRYSSSRSSSTRRFPKPVMHSPKREWSRTWTAPCHRSP